MVSEMKNFNLVRNKTQPSCLRSKKKKKLFIRNQSSVNEKKKNHIFDSIGLE